MKVIPLRYGILAMALLSGPMAWAQEERPADSATTATAPEGAPPPAPAPATTESAPAAPSLEARVAELEGKLAKSEETVSSLESSMSSLKKLKISGYVQGRYEWHDDAVDGWENQKSQNRFSVRHGYLSARYEGTYGEYFLQFDGNNSDGFVMKDAEASLIEPWTPLKIKLTIGQFKLPFGYEIGQSDADREMPERAAVIPGLFANDRDRGFRLQTKYEMLRFSAALVNGANLVKKEFKNEAGFVQNSYVPTAPKTVVARLGVDLGSFVAGLSGLWGRTLETPDDPGKTKWDYTTYKKYEQIRLGADVQGYIDIPGLGGLALKGEVIWARKKSLAYNDIKADPCLGSQSFGWILTLVQNLGDFAGVAVRLDQYDPMLASKVDGSCHEAKGTASRDMDKVYRLGVAGLLHASANTKVTLSYEHPWEENGAKKNNDIVTAQLQARF